MSAVTVVPTSVLLDGAGWVSVGGAASKSAALADSDDGTRIEESGTSGKNIKFLLGPANLPDGSAIVSLAPTLRMSRSVNPQNNTFVSLVGMQKVPADDSVLDPGYGYFYSRTLPLESVVAVNLASSGAHTGTADDPASAAGQRLRLDFDVTAGSFSGLRIHSAQVVVNYVQAPTATSLAVAAGQLTQTQKPVHTYTYTSPDSVAFYELQAATWLVSDLASYPGGQAAFEADPEAAFADAANVGSPSFGTRVARAWTMSPDTGKPGWSRPSQSTSWTPDQALPFTGAMKTYLRVAATYAGQRLSRKNAAGVSTVSFTMNVTPPAAPTAVVATWQGIPNYRTKIDVSLAADTARRVYVERSQNGVQWFPLPRGTFLGVTAAAQTITTYDTAPVPGVAMKYRARTAHPTLEAYSAYAAAPDVTTGSTGFVLRDPLDTAAPVLLRWLNDLESSADEILGETRGLGASLPTFVGDAIGGQRWAIEVQTPDEASYLALKRLRARRATMVLAADMAGYWYWVRFGSSWQETVLRSTQRRVATQRARRIRLELIETFPIAGQPNPNEMAGTT